MDKTVKRTSDGAGNAGREAWIKPEIETLNAREAMIPKIDEPEGGSGSIFPI
ncbi:hypothetical protein P7L70_20945 [Tistrella mobilis]|uniref:hypothetical protein n=1 Tax=Tistrella mobilis TaxID=171437 RepID=UPI00355934DA